MKLRGEGRTASMVPQWSECLEVKLIQHKLLMQIGMLCSGQKHFWSEPCGRESEIVVRYVRCWMSFVQKSYKILNSQNSLEGHTQITPWLSVLFYSGVLFSYWLPEVAKAGPGEEERGGQEKLKSAVDAFSYLILVVALFIIRHLSNSFPKQM